jgi:hypothetical protein
MKNLQAGIISPFNAIVDYQRFASALVMSQSSPPETRVSADGLAVSYKEHTLHVPQWIKGLHTIQDETKNLIDKLCHGYEISLEIPDDVPDDWTEVTRGYSWIDNGKFVQDNRPLLKILMGDKDLRIATVDRGGNLQYNTSAIMKIMKSTSAINGNLSFLAFTTPGQPSRSTEFVDHKIRNSTRPRTIFRSGKDIWLAVRRESSMKT